MVESPTLSEDTEGMNLGGADISISHILGTTIEPRTGFGVPSICSKKSHCLLKSFGEIQISTYEGGLDIKIFHHDNPTTLAKIFSWSWSFREVGHERV